MPSLQGSGLEAWWLGGSRVSGLRCQGLLGLGFRVQGLRVQGLFEVSGSTPGGPSPYCLPA